MVTEGEAALARHRSRRVGFRRGPEEGFELVVKGTSQKGNLMTDNYDLSGVTAALGEIAKACS